MLPGSTPTVMVDGQAASLNLTSSSEHVLSVIAPPGLRASNAAVITVNNGNGTGAATLDRSIAIVTGASGDPFGLGVGWTAAFTPLMSRTINAATDSRLTSRVVCDGRNDDGPALQGALIYAQRNGGGVVTLPAGVCRLGSGVQVFSNTVLQGAGKDLTEIRHVSKSPIYAYSADLLAVRSLTLTNIGSSASASLNLKYSSRVVVHGVRVNQADSAMAWIYGITNLAVVGSDFLQTGSRSPGPVNLFDNAGVVFIGNSISFLNGNGTNFSNTRDAYVEGNKWTRDAVRQYDPNVSHVVTLDFARRIAVINNTFTAINGPLDPANNDGETILTEGGGARRTEGIGQVTAATSNTLSDSTGAVNPNVFVNGLLPDNYGIAIVAGKGAGQTRRVTAFSGGRFTVNRAWDVQPDASSRYATATWGLEMSLIKGNRLSNNPRGILLYSTAVRQVAIVGNTLSENGGILVRSFQKMSSNLFTAIVDVGVLGNNISNTTRRYPSYLSVHFANNDGQAFGTSHVGVEVRRNMLTANNPNIDDSRFSGHSGREGYMNQMNVETSVYQATTMPRLLGTILQNNTCTNCATAFRLGTGAAGTSLVDNRLINSGALWSNSATATGTGVAIGTWVR